MQGNQAHLSDEELLLFSDQELPRRRASTVREHVAQCELSASVSQSSNMLRPVLPIFMNENSRHRALLHGIRAIC